MLFKKQLFNQRLFNYYIINNHVSVILQIQNFLIPGVPKKSTYF